jgi:hypothetical protein
MARQYANLVKVALAFNGALTATGAKTAISDPRLGDFISGWALLNVFSVSGTTPASQINVEGSDDGSTYVTLGSFASAAAAGAQIISLDQLKPWMRINAITLAGTSTPTVNASVVIVAEQTKLLPGDGTVISS